MKIWCKNYNCPENRKLDLPVLVKPRKNYIPIGEEDILYSGECQSKILNIAPVGLLGVKVDYSVALCVISKEKNAEMFICGRENCVHNSNQKCLKDEIIIDSIIVDKEIYWVCKNFSQTKISGHKDWSANLDSEGHPKFGGHIDDSYSEKLDHENRVARNYPDHHREEKEDKRKRSA